jgi:hypothetical protein
MTHNSGVAMCHSSARGPFYDEITNHPLGGRDRGAAWWTYARLARGSALALDATRLVWINDFLPNQFAELIRANMDKAVVAMKQTLKASVGH